MHYRAYQSLRSLEASLDKEPAPPTGVRKVLDTNLVLPKRRKHLQSIVRSIPLRTEEIVNRANAYTSRSAPFVSLTKIAHLLKADINWNSEAASGKNAIIRLSEGSRWIIDIKEPKTVESRHTLAHELGHALLYSNNNFVPDTEAWARRSYSNIEEVICNAFARWLIAPRQIESHLEEQTLPRAALKGASLLRLPLQQIAIRLLETYQWQAPHPEVVVIWSNKRPSSIKTETFLELHLCKRLCMKPHTGLLFDYSKMVEQLTFTRNRQSFIEQFFHARIQNCPNKRPCISSIDQETTAAAYNMASKLSTPQLTILKEETLSYFTNGLPRIQSLHWHEAGNNRFIKYDSIIASPETSIGQTMRLDRKVHTSNLEQIKLGTISGERHIESTCWGSPARGTRMGIQYIWSTNDQPHNDTFHSEKAQEPSMYFRGDFENEA